MELEIRIFPYARSMGSPNREPYYTMRITLKYRGRVFGKEVINPYPLPELYSTMDYLFEAARKEMKATILTYMQTGSPVQGLEHNYTEQPPGG
jgi:hypothetical protein